MLKKKSPPIIYKKKSIREIYISIQNALFFFKKGRFILRDTLLKRNQDMLQ